MQGNTKFSISKLELEAFFGLCLFRGVFKGRNEPLSSFWETEHGRPIFRETMSRNKFQAILRYIFDLTIKFPDRIAEELTSLLQFENYGIQ